MGKKVTVDLDKLKAALYDRHVQEFTKALDGEPEDDQLVINDLMAADRTVALMISLDESGGE